MSTVKVTAKVTAQAASSPFTVTPRSVYVSAQSNPEQSYFFFAYRIVIKNTSDAPAQLVSRHWVITDGTGSTEEVKGPGVIGQQPKIKPGQEFEYESACPLPTSTGSMKGTYQMRTDDGRTFDIEVPEFFLISPLGLH